MGASAFLMYVGLVAKTVQSQEELNIALNNEISPNIAHSTDSTVQNNKRALIYYSLHCFNPRLRSLSHM